jgi:glycosyltransferase involved in cell wall biosynthesis
MNTLAVSELGGTDANVSSGNGTDVGGKSEFERISLSPKTVSILIASYNTKPVYIRECIDSMIGQNGNFIIELVWINDGTDAHGTQLLESELRRFQTTLKNATVIYRRLTSNHGLSYCLHEGLLLCSNEIVFRMDCDDIMAPERLNIQYNFMNNTSDCVMCGTNMISFNADVNSKNKKRISSTNHPYKITWEEYKFQKMDWIMNHPTLCFLKSAVLNVGNYNKNMKLPFEDLELELRILKRYGCLYNLPEMLLMYRVHDQQITQYHKHNTKIIQKRKEYIEYITNTDT